MIEERSIAVAECDACGHRDFADEDGSFFGGEGYGLRIVAHRTGASHNVYACRETHIGKAARSALAQWREDNGWWRDDDSTLTPVADAPPLSADDTDDDTDDDTADTQEVAR